MTIGRLHNCDKFGDGAGRERGRRQLNVLALDPGGHRQQVDEVARGSSNGDDLTVLVRKLARQVSEEDDDDFAAPAAMAERAGKTESRARRWPTRRRETRNRWRPGR